MSHHCVDGCYMEGNTFIQPDQAQGNYTIPSNSPFYEKVKPDFYCSMTPPRSPIMRYPPLINDGPCECISHLHEDHVLRPTMICHCCNDDYVKPEPPKRMEIPSVVNIETKLIVSVKVTLYSVREEDDVTLILSEGKKYKILYVTKDGVFERTGILKVIDTNIPIREYQYIGNTDAIAQDAYLILDSSTVGNAEVHKIFINTIRSITEIVDEVEEEPSKDTEPKDEDIITNE